jgi:hypothetical protein
MSSTCPQHVLNMSSTYAFPPGKYKIIFAF